MFLIRNSASILFQPAGSKQLGNVSTRQNEAPACTNLFLRQTTLIDLTLFAHEAHNKKQDNALEGNSCMDVSQDTATTCHDMWLVPCNYIRPFLLRSHFANSTPSQRTAAAKRPGRHGCNAKACNSHCAFAPNVQVWGGVTGRDCQQCIGWGPQNPSGIDRDLRFLPEGGAIANYLDVLCVVHRHVAFMAASRALRPTPARLTHTGNSTHNRQS